MVTFVLSSRLGRLFQAFCSWALSQRQTLVTLGDLDLDRLQPESVKGNVLLDLEDIFQLECLIKIPTRTKALLDVILTNKLEMFDQSGVIEFGLSDNQMSYTFLKPNLKHHPAKVISFRNTKHLDLDALRADVDSLMRTLELDNCESTQEQYNRWHNALTEALDRHMPIKKLRVRERDAPFIIREWRAAIREKRKYAKCHKKLQTDEIDQLRKKWRNIATSIRRKSIKQNWRERFDDLRTNPRTFFKTFTPFLRDEGCGETVIHLIKGRR